VTEDEAFIRAIVDSPGDDTPRLVYADWLDERNDPRGAYLRAEYEWAEPWQTGERPADSPELREMAKVLDPVWTTRVSRPPVGVCACHFRIVERLDDPAVTLSDLDGLQAQARVRLPLDYVAFLLNHNGGYTRPLRHARLVVASGSPVLVSWFRVIGEGAYWTDDPMQSSDSDTPSRPTLPYDARLREPWDDDPEWAYIAHGMRDYRLAVAGERSGAVQSYDRWGETPPERRWASLADFMGDVMPYYPSYFAESEVL
jgi:uncharacterized protein (TIGR02996 family)